MSSIARLHILFAKNAPIGVIFRRGPSKQVRLILWHTDTDTFIEGQWFKGRIYEERAALTPDGKLLSYFAMDLRKRRYLRPEADPKSTSAWVAISRPPYLTALALWFYWDTHDGATTFPDNRTFLISGQCTPAAGRELPNEFKVGNLPSNRSPLTNRGWSYIPERKIEDANQAPAYGAAQRSTDYYEKRIGGGIASLELRLNGLDKGGEFCLRNLTNGQSVPLEVNYAEVDLAGRLILAQDGKIYAASSVQHDLRIIKTELYDFNKMTFEAVTTPNWAQQWPSE